jgi:hypothetical protein
MLSTELLIVFSTRTISSQLHHELVQDDRMNIAARSLDAKSKHSQNKCLPHVASNHQQRRRHAALTPA